jgi:RNA polymerase sigma-70 factor (ECF subfamily)
LADSARPRRSRRGDADSSALPTQQGRTTDDAEAVARTLDGDRDAYACLVARYTAPAHRAAVLLGAGSEAEDVVQEAFVKAYAKLRGFRSDRAFRPWLLRIVVNETKNLHRSRGRRQALALRLGTDDSDPASEPEAVTLEAERQRALLRALEALPDRERHVLVCRYFLDLDVAETATALGCPRGSVKSRTSRGLARLRERLAELERTEVSDA